MRYMILSGPEPVAGLFLDAWRNHSPKAVASSVNPEAEQRQTENEPSRTHVYR